MICCFSDFNRPGRPANDELPNPLDKLMFTILSEKSLTVLIKKLPLIYKLPNYDSLL